jgi:hypothetical protein
MNEETKKEFKVFKLSEEELTNLKYRRGYPGLLMNIYPPRSKEELPNPHGNYKVNLASYYRQGKYVSVREDLMSALNALLPPRKVKKQEELETE